jgi:hypothetical protein
LIQFEPRTIKNKPYTKGSNSCIIAEYYDFIRNFLVGNTKHCKDDGGDNTCTPPYCPYAKRDVTKYMFGKLAFREPKRRE